MTACERLINPSGNTVEVLASRVPHLLEMGFRRAEAPAPEGAGRVLTMDELDAEAPAPTAEDAEIPPSVEEFTAALQSMDRPALFEVAEELGLDIHPSTATRYMIGHLVNAYEASQIGAATE